MAPHALGATALTVTTAYVRIWAATLIPAVAVAVTPRAPAGLRHAYGFELRATDASTGDLVAILSTNARFVAALWLLSAVGRALPRLRRPSATGLSILTCTNAAVVGAAVGAYGSRAFPYLLHLPIEWGALAVTWAACTSGWSVRAALRVAVALLTAATIEILPCP